MVTAMYCRTAQACDMGIFSQQATLRQYAEDNDYTNIAVYSDNGYSGSNLDRPAMRQLQADAEAGIVGRVIIKDVARVSRNFQDLHDFIDFMADMGVEVKFSTGDFDMGESFSAMLKVRQGIYQQFLQSKRRTQAV